MRLGDISKQFESGNRGPGAISFLLADPGGKSYGSYQFSKMSLILYTQSSIFKFEEKIYSDGFDDAWKRIAVEYPFEFDLDQYLFIVKTHYLPLSIYAIDLGYDTNNRMIQEALFSISVQHGKAKYIVEKAFLDVSVEAQIHSLYDTRLKYVLDLFLDPKIYEALKERYKKELTTILTMEK